MCMWLYVARCHDMSTHMCDDKSALASWFPFQFLHFRTRTLNELVTLRSILAIISFCGQLLLSYDACLPVHLTKPYQKQPVTPAPSPAEERVALFDSHIAQKKSRKGLHTFNFTESPKKNLSILWPLLLRDLVKSHQSWLTWRCLVSFWPPTEWLIFKELKSFEISLGWSAYCCFGVFLECLPFK